LLVDIQEKYYPEFFSRQDIWNRQYHYEASTKTANQVITISEFSKESIARHHNVPKNKINVIHLAADESFYRPLTRPVRSSLQLPEHFIFYPANRWHHKNHDALLKALVVLKEKHDAIIPCVFTGHDYENGYPLSRKIKEYGLEAQCRVIGYVSNDDLRYVYSKARLLCFPSLFEGFGMPLIEAMASGCPVVCSNATSLPEVAGDAALLFDPNDPSDMAGKIYAAWIDSGLRRKIAAAGKERSKLFSVTQMAARHIEVFESARSTYNKRRYLYYKFITEPMHTFKMQTKRFFHV
jgi:glycosyltransferase involved in cell wall biosynthesis